MKSNKFLKLLKTDLCHIVESSKPIEIRERSASGEGTCTFACVNDVLMIKAKDKHSALWALLDGSCAEGAFLEIKSCGKKVLHILEMKSTCSLKTFVKVCKQLEGMYYSSLAVMAVLQLGTPEQVISYLAYNSSDLDNREKLPFYQNKPMVGSRSEKTEAAYHWKDNKVRFSHLTSKLVKGLRDENGNYDFGLV